MIRNRRQRRSRSPFRQLFVNGHWMSATEAMRLVDTTTELAGDAR